MNTTHYHIHARTRTQTAAHEFVFPARNHSSPSHAQTCTRTAAAVSWFRSTSTTRKSTCAKSRAISKNLGLIFWHGPHQAAVKLTTTSCSPALARSWSNSALPSKGTVTHRKDSDPPHNHTLTWWPRQLASTWTDTVGPPGLTPAVWTAAFADREVQSLRNGLSQRHGERRP